MFPMFGPKMGLFLRLFKCKAKKQNEQIFCKPQKYAPPSIYDGC